MKRLHVVGASSMEMTATLLYLWDQGHRSIVLHDLAPDHASVEARLAQTHAFYPAQRLCEIRDVISALTVQVGAHYLKNISEDDEIFAPQSWYVHPQNAPLSRAKSQGRLTTFADLCFRLFPGRIVAVTGTVGKSTTAKLTATLTNGILSGNDRENILDLRAIAAAKPSDVLVFETSNRHLHHGLARAADVGILTNICPNHIPDHGSLDAYARTKHRIFQYAKRTIYNAQNPYPALGITPPQGGVEPHDPFSHQPFVGAAAYIDQETLVVLGQALTTRAELQRLCPTSAWLPHELENLLAASLAALRLGLDLTTQRARLKHTQKPKYRCEVSTEGARQIINNAGACLPECTRRLVEALRQPFALILGGDRQTPQPGEFDALAASIAANPAVEQVFIIGPMQTLISSALFATGYRAFTPCDDLEAAVRALTLTPQGAVVFSPGCGVGRDYLDKYERGRHFERLMTTYWPHASPVEG